MAEDNDSDDQLDDFIHSYSYSDDDVRAHPSSGEEDASYSDSGSEPPEDPSAEEEDVALYDLYDNSARPSPHPPSSPTLQATRLELDPTLDDIEEEPKIRHPKRRKRVYVPRTSFTPSARTSGDANSAPAEDSSESGAETSDDEESGE